MRKAYATSYQPHAFYKGTYRGRRVFEYPVIFTVRGPDPVGEIMRGTVNTRIVHVISDRPADAAAWVFDRMDPGTCAEATVIGPKGGRYAFCRGYESTIGRILLHGWHRGPLPQQFPNWADLVAVARAPR